MNAITLDLPFEHAFRDALRDLRQRMLDVGASEYYATIRMSYTTEKLTWTVLIGTNYENSFSIDGEVLSELIDLAIDTMLRKNNIKLRALPAPEPTVLAIEHEVEG